MAAILVTGVLGVGVAVYAQAPTPLQPSDTPEPAKRPPPRQAAKPAPKPRPKSDAQAQQPAEASPQPQTQPRPQQAEQTPPGTVFDEQAKQAKIVACANVFGALGRGVATDSTYTAQTQWDARAGDAHSVQSVVALSTTANPAAKAADIVFAAPVGRSCEGTLVRVTPTSDYCQAVGAELMKQNGKAGAVGDLPLVALPNGAQVMLVPFGDACVAVTTLRG